MVRMAMRYMLFQCSSGNLASFPGSLSSYFRTTCEKKLDKEPGNEASGNSLKTQAALWPRSSGWVRLVN